MRAHGRERQMGKRFAIVIGVAAAGVMGLGAQTAAAEVKTFEYTSKFKSGRYRGASGHFKGSARVESGSTVIVGGCEGKLGSQRPGSLQLWLRQSPARD